ncbi:MAG: hypothetical protein KIT83_22490 [Bryobacterales bacterium]|nr:hypothetical protein [Bryobacterales bacterium]
MAVVLFGLPAGMLLLVLLLRKGLSWMEDRGYLIVSEVTDSKRSLGGSLLELQELVQPSARYVAEEREAADILAVEDESGDGQPQTDRQRRDRLREAIHRQQCKR